MTVVDLTLEETTTGKERTVTLLQFLSWPDHGAPDTALPLLRVSTHNTVLTTQYSQSNTHNTVLTKQNSQNCTQNTVLTTQYSQHSTHNTVLNTQFSQHSTHNTVPTTL